jgi:anti-sigma factor RsiW
MSYDSPENRLRETGWRRHLTPAEQAELQSLLHDRPEAKPDWEAEQALTEALQRLPDVPVASNFTARAVDAALRDRASKAQPEFWPQFRSWGWNNWLPRVAFGLVIALAGFLSYQQVHRVQNEKIARSASVLSEVAAVPGPDALRDFDAIRALDTSPAADEELLRLMQ